MPIARQVRATRTAISPRFATRSLRKSGGTALVQHKARGFCDRRHCRCDVGCLASTCRASSRKGREGEVDVPVRLAQERGRARRIRQRANHLLRAGPLPHATPDGRKPLLRGRLPPLLPGHPRARRTPIARPASRSWSRARTGSRPPPGSQPKRTGSTRSSSAATAPPRSSCPPIPPSRCDTSP